MVSCQDICPAFILRVSVSIILRMTSVRYLPLLMNQPQGPNCQDTKTFTKAANLRGFQTLLRGCKAQLKDSSIKYHDIDYGFGWKKSLPLTWATFSKGQKAGVAIGIIFATLITLYLLILCAVIIADSNNHTPSSRSAYSYQLEQLEVFYSRYEWD